MKRIYKSVLAVAVLALALSACSSRLDVTNPNYFTDDDIQKYMDGGDDNVNTVISGLANVLNEFVMAKDSWIGNGITPRDGNEVRQEVRRFVQSGDVVEGSRTYQGTHYLYYQNNGSVLPYWESDQAVPNYGIYVGPVKKISYAQRVLDYVPDTVSTPAKKGYRAMALTIKAMGYMELMERYTDLQDVTSTTAQGWPIYDRYAYNDPQPPLSVAETWEWIKNAIDEAVKDFKASNIGTGGYTIGTSDLEVHDVDCGVAQYVRARVALDTKDWATVIDACNDVLSHYPNFIAPSDYGMDESKLASVASRNANGWNGTTYNASENAFYNIEKNPEVIFGQRQVTDGLYISYNGVEGTTISYWSDFNSLMRTPNGYYQMDENLYNSMSDNDCRKSCFLSKPFENYPIYNYSSNDTTWYSYTMPAYTNLKWAASEAFGYTNHDNTHNVADFVYLRSSSLLLMGAEAYAQSGQDSQAKALLNRLLAARTKVGAPTMTCDNTMSGMSTMDMVRLQWRLEMWGEGDWSFFNEKRWNWQPTRGANHWSTNQIPRFTWEIPLQERQGNPYWN